MELLHDCVGLHMQSIDEGGFQGSLLLNLNQEPAYRCRAGTLPSQWSHLQAGSGCTERKK